MTKPSKAQLAALKRLAGGDMIHSIMTTGLNWSHWWHGSQPFEHVHPAMLEVLAVRKWITSTSRYSGTYTISDLGRQVLAEQQGESDGKA